MGSFHRTCESLQMLFNERKSAAENAYRLCKNYTLIDYASNIVFLSPFVRAYYIPEQFNVNGHLDLFIEMKMKQPRLFCLVGEYICKGVRAIQNGSICIEYDDIFEKSYPFPPYEYFFCRLENSSDDYCTNTSFYYRCRTTGECISKHRLFDGFVDSLDSSDEEDLEALNSLDRIFMKDRYNCTIDGRQAKAVMRHFLGMF
ncbi:unnamed protein product [Didymodactylos carnosus]|uniref:Uncharacterized protein n=1 Tax=Didymodactylos carnosus TaxID=1234261 RepID=A0A815EGK5_9BILA|nr:unnamed protein product [Didymodactylos carnosus]CAF1314808.1 unnamed protein product [Didymodactylos carnosus]CAF4002496.1 unnamed protein product [Didymodactylos carnosus]CAF4155458.1 unnamed protein product [Didymodactylos carnosus]